MAVKVANTDAEKRRGLTGTPKGTEGIFNYMDSRPRRFVRTDRDLRVFADGKYQGNLTKDNPELVINSAQQIVEKPMASGGGLKRSEDYGSSKKPYPSVQGKDFAGGDRSYPIPTKADAVDALRLAGLHGRSDVKAKVYTKYPELKHSSGGKTKGLYDLMKC